MAIPTMSHTVKKGETLIGIVKKHGFNGKAYKKIYGAPYNAKLRKKRPDPNVILPGDVVNLPIVSKNKLEAAWDVVFNAKNALTDPLEEKKSRLLSLLGPNRKILAETKKELAQIKADAKVATPGYGKSYEKKLRECQKPWLDKSRGLGGMVECTVALAKYEADLKKTKQSYDEWIKEEADKVAKYEAKIKAIEDTIKTLDSTIAVIEVPFEKSMSLLGKLSKETF